jgi:DNA-binding CsgD family transcriptional regulator
MFIDTEFQQINTSLGAKTLKRANASAVALLLHDRKQNQPVNFLFHTGVQDWIIDLYASSIHQYDPMLQHALNDHPESSFTGVNYKDAQMVPVSYQTENKRYWQTLGQEGFWETATCKKVLSKDLSLVIGLMMFEPERRKGYHLALDRGMSTLDNWLQLSCDYLIESAFRRCYTQPELRVEDQIGGTDQLTRRESQVVEELLKGQSNKQIGKTLFLSKYTVENHLKNIYRKLGVDSRAALIAGLHRL